MWPQQVSETSVVPQAVHARTYMKIGEARDVWVGLKPTARLQIRANYHWSSKSGETNAFGDSSQTIGLKLTRGVNILRRAWQARDSAFRRGEP